MEAQISRRRMLGVMGGAVGAAALGGTVAPGSAHAQAVPGTVFTMTNGAAGNEVIRLQRGHLGNLVAAGTYPTGGLGTGGGLGNQGAVVLSDSRHWLLVVNAGSNDVSAFRVAPNGLTLTDRLLSGGQMPISVSVHRDLVYVLNDGGVSNISGLRLSPQGKLSPIPSSTRPLSTAAPDAAQVQFSPDGRVLVVSEKANNVLNTFMVGHNGVPGTGNPQPSHGMTPFGFSFSRLGRMFVSEAFGGAPDGSACSSYDLSGNGILSLLDGSEPTTETAACWAAATADGRFAYVTNTGSGTITGYSVARNGQLSRLQADGVTAGAPGRSPVDLAIDRTGQYLDVLNSGTDTINSYRIGHDGRLTEIGLGVSVPDRCNGLASY